MPQRTVPAPRTPHFNPYAECSHCGTSAGMCAIHITNQLDAFDRAWADGTHKLFISIPAWSTDEQVETRRQLVRAQLENRSRCCAGCTMHGY